MDHLLPDHACTHCTWLRTPQDVYRRLSEPAALGGLLRLRASPELRIGRAYGASLLPDPRFDNLHHVVAAGPRTAFAFDLDYADPAGLPTDRAAPPVLQMVFRYSVLVPKEAAAASEGTEEGAANGGHTSPATRKG